MKHLYLLLAAVIATLPAFAQHATAPALDSQRRFSAPAEQERPDEMARLMAGAGSSTAAARPLRRHHPPPALLRQFHLNGQTK
jgi:hypothetical protein